MLAGVNPSTSLLGSILSSNSSASICFGAVNEALNLCDEFAEPKEKPFINGMLANFVK